MGQDLGLHSDGTPSESKGKGKYSVEELAMRRNVYGVTLILDLFLSLQLGRPSAIVQAQIFSEGSSASYPNLAGSLTPTADPRNTPFAYTVSLCRIVSCINLYLYLGISGSTNTNANADLSPEMSTKILTSLKAELDIWHQTLPVQFRISIGHQPTREVIELNMLYNVAIILLYRPL
jgi:hypothetical protein